MHGKYKCSIKTDLGSYESLDENIIIISQQQCKLSDWRIVSDASRCQEVFKLDCRNMFPKPEPSCGLWNGKLEKFIQSVMVDISLDEATSNKTYRIKYNDKFELLNSIDGGGSAAAASNYLLQYAGHLYFKCDISVPETSWRLNLQHKMFNFNDGCIQDPLETIERMRFNYSQYATLRMQQDGYLVAQSDNIVAITDQAANKLSAKSKHHHDHQHRHDFEMLPGANLKYQLVNSAGWSKAVELNCWRKPRHGTLAHLSCSQKGHQGTKLIGANYLECRDNQWHLAQRVEFIDGKSASKQPRSGRKVESNEDQSSQDVDAASSEPVQYQGNSNDLATVAANGDEASARNRNEVEFIPINQQQHQQTPSAQYMASILPSCVSSRRPQVSNRLPLLDKTRTLESSDPNSQRSSPGGSRHKSISIFSSSSSSPGSAFKLVAQHYWLLFLLNGVVSILSLSFPANRLPPTRRHLLQEN